MGETAIGTIETMLESALEDVEDSETKYKHRQALSLLTVIEEQHIEAREALEEVGLDPEIRDNLQELGCL